MEVLDELDEAWIHPKEFFMVSPERFENALENIETELDGRVAELKSQGKDLQAYRLEQRTQYDLEMLRKWGIVPLLKTIQCILTEGAGKRPYCLLDFFSAAAKQFHGDPQKFLVIMDESHVTLPQVGGMYGGDKSRKLNLIEHGFRLPSAADTKDR